MQAMIFGSASSPCSAQYVKNTNAMQFKEKYGRAVTAIIERHYVDSFDTVDEAIQVSNQAVNIHKEAGFQLRGFISNSDEVTTQLNNDATAVHADKTTSMCRDENSEKILGILANNTIRAKIIMQEIWRTNTAWDMPVPDKMYQEWYKWYNGLSQLEELRIPRCYDEHFTNSKAVVELHVFVDASEMAFAAVAYWRIVYQEKMSVMFVAAKSRCSPIRPLSIPRLELQAAVLGTRLSDAITCSHDVTPNFIYYWSDFKTVINWINADCRQYKQFVIHRIAEILNATESSQWNWVPGSLNPADEATRMRQKICISDSKWLTGPKFLKEPKQNCPKLPEDIPKHGLHNERRAGFLFTITHNPKIIEFNNFSSYYRMLRAMAMFLRAATYFKAKGSKTCKLEEGPLKANEITKAELKICCLVQAERYYEEINLLSQGKVLPKSSTIYELTPVLDECGVLRLSGRIEKAQYVTLNVKRPIIMPKHHVVTILIIKYYHEKCLHQNQKFWIPSLRQQVRSYTSRCQLCKNLSARPKPPLMGQLPEDRLAAFVRPFTYTGLDYFGPLTITIGRRHEKRWVALFTCLTIRAIHLELARDLSADAAIACLRNFVIRRGVPVRIRCDRGTNFVGASRDQKAVIGERFANECATRNIEWVFNTPANPSAGGAWERMVRSVKRVLAFTLQEKAPQIETVISLLIEAENLINSRPLTDVPLEHDAAEPITPNHFLIGAPNFVQTPCVEKKSCPRKQYQILQLLKQTFWKRWVLEYIAELTRRTKWHHRVDPIKIGDVVLVCDENQTRGDGSKGLITEIFPAADGQVRSATVKTKTGSLRRPASKLAVLDVLGESDRDSVHGGEDVKN